MSTPRLELVGLRKDFADGSVAAVDGIDLTVAAGETLALLGPSGCGKSTTLNLIVGLETPSAGDIRIDGVSVLGVPAGARNVGLVFQDYAVFTHMTVAGNLGFGLEVRGLPRREITRRVADVAGLLGLSDLMGVRASRLGGSQLQRVAIGRTLVTRPKILLLDEPLSNLETEARLAMRRELRRLQAETGITIIYVTHDQIEALSLASRIAVMSHGKIRQCDAAASVYDRPVHVFVAGFMGSPPMNLLHGVVARQDGAVRFIRDGFVVDLPDRLPPSDASVVLGIRPEAVRLARADAATLAGTVTLVQPTGPEAVVSIDIGGVVLLARIASHGRPQEGDRVGVSIDQDRVVLFSAATGDLLPTSGAVAVAA